MHEIATGWKALILAAGFGTRLLPHTRHTPKPLFSISNRPLLGIIIDRLIASGCGGIVINTHHLAHRIESFLEEQQYPVPVQTRHEPDILGTGGAVGNVADVLGNRPFMVVNSDIFTDIDLERVYTFHCGHDAPVTLVLHDHPAFNSVFVNQDDCVTGFAGMEDTASSETHTRRLAFTGIHVMDPEILTYMPPAGAHGDIIAIYRDMIRTGHCLMGRIVENHKWHDIGTPASYRQIAFEAMAQKALILAFGEADSYSVSPIAPDGSDTRWWRITSQKGSLVACDRGIRETEDNTETDAFVAIGHHLHRTTGTVPRIFIADRFAGLVFMEDLGDCHLQTTLRKKTDAGDIRRIYQHVIERLVVLATRGHEGFDTAWTCQTATYDKTLILEKECNYFARSFLGHYLGMADMAEPLAAEFNMLADMTLDHAVTGLMHRDMQSRNIMLCKAHPFFIDFQGARTGPVQYDLSALLIDPYAALPESFQAELLDSYRQRLACRMKVDKTRFDTGYACCAVTRNLQILGAFGFLTTQKNKHHFSAYIPHAVTGLLPRLQHLEAATKTAFPRLKKTIKKAISLIGHYHATH